MRKFRYFVSYQTAQGAIGNKEVVLKRPIDSYIEMEKIQNSIQIWRAKYYKDPKLQDDRVIILYWRRF